jgi:hypothetical protein
VFATRLDLRIPKPLARARTSAAIVVLAIVPLLAMPPLSAEAPADPAFQRTWARTDQPVQQGQVNRTWMWGPEAFTGGLMEPYAEGQGGQRIVQYFDKARMEITNPNVDSSSVWYVTNGLLVVELITGRVQVGDGAYEDRSPAVLNVAGDADDQAGPTYATFAGLLDASPLPVSGTIIQRVARDGTVVDDPFLAERGVTGVVLDDVTGHTIAAPFWDFMTSSGTVWDGASYVQAPLFENAYFATGRPITEAYWAEVRVAGTPRDVLIQCFERRCLTYTPENPAGWQVEAGNVGQHYYAWRYERAGSGCPWSEPFPATLALGDVIQSTLHFQVDGCSAGISRIDLKVEGQELRGVTFDPPMPAWSAGPAGAMTWAWDGGGSFSGQTNMPVAEQTFVQRQTGSYSVSVEARLIPQANGGIIWIQGEWREEGSAQLCLDDDCRELPWNGQPGRRWFWAVNTASGAVGATPDDVR